jgi:hypothetical protein
MKNLLAAGLAGLAALGLGAAPAAAGTFGLFTYSCGNCKCGCLVRPYNAFTPALCYNPPCIDNAFPNPVGCYAGCIPMQTNMVADAWGYASPLNAWGQAYNTPPGMPFVGHGPIGPIVGWSPGYAPLPAGTPVQTAPEQLKVAPAAAER